MITDYYPIVIITDYQCYLNRNKKSMQGKPRGEKATHTILRWKQTQDFEVSQKSSRMRWPPWVENYWTNVDASSSFWSSPSSSSSSCSALLPNGWASERVSAWPVGWKDSGRNFFSPNMTKLKRTNRVACTTASESLLLNGLWMNFWKLNVLSTAASFTGNESRKRATSANSSLTLKLLCLPSWTASKLLGMSPRQFSQRSHGSQMGWHRLPPQI